jgi:hypothetical protein
MRHNYYELSSDSLDLCKGKLTPGVTATWGEIAGNIETQKDLVSYISAHGTAAWGSISGSITDQTDLIEYTDRFATTAWVQSQGYLTEHQDLTGYATESWVSEQGYITSAALRGYATTSWVLSQNYAKWRTFSFVGGSDMSTIITTGSQTEEYEHSRDFLLGYNNYYNPNGNIDTTYLYANPNGIQKVDRTITSGGIVLYENVQEMVTQGAGRYVVWNHAISDDMELPDNYPFDVYTEDYYGEGIYRFGSFNPETFEFHGIQIDQDVAGRYTVMPFEDTYDEVFDEFATQTWVQEQGYITTSALSSYATQSWVQSQDYVTKDWLENDQEAHMWLNGEITGWYNTNLDPDIRNITARLSALETNYGDALSITNNILS